MVERHAEFAILGAGAMGSILAAHLVRAGHAVTVIARERRATQIEHDGLRISGLVDIDVPVRVLRDPTQLSGAETLIVAMKAPGTREVLGRFRPGAVCVALSIQNGPGKTEVLIDAFGRGRVLGAMADTSGERLASGAVAFTRNVNLLIGELDGEVSPRVEHLAGTLDAAGVRAAGTGNIRGVEWSKFCAWAGLMAMSLTLRSPTWCYLSDAGSAVVLARLVRELGSLAIALGVGLTDGAVLPVATLCAVDEPRAADIIRGLGAAFKASAPSHKMSSLQDLEAGRRLEVEDTLGFAHARAVQLGLYLPLLDAFYHLTSALDRLDCKP